MSATGSAGAVGALRSTVNAVFISGLGLLAGACAQLGAAPPQLAAAGTAAVETAAAADTRSELQKATEYWGKAYAKEPHDAQTALNLARNLKALGEKRQAIAVLQQISLLHPGHRGINAEYGRLALEFDQVSLAGKLLEQADDPAKPDWTVISARGTVFAKQGRYGEAIPLYERALVLAPDQASVLNNLALAHAMQGHADKAEAFLKRAAAAGGHDARVSQNLALVLGLQGKYDEAKLAAAKDLSADKAAANVDFVRQIVNVEPKPLTTAAIAPAGEPGRPAAIDAGTGWTTQVADARKKEAR
jgi:Flp pilus assembly protein TadD